MLKNINKRTDFINFDFKKCLLQSSVACIIKLFNFNNGRLQANPLDKLKLTGQNLSLVFNSICGCACLYHAIKLRTKTAYFKLETLPKRILDSLMLAIALPA